MKPPSSQSLAAPEGALTTDMHTVFSTLILAAAVLSAPGASAQVVKCVGADGKTEYRNAPCPGAATGRALPPVGAAPAAAPATGPAPQGRAGTPSPEQTLLCPPLQAAVKQLYQDNERWRRGARESDPVVAATGGNPVMNTGLQADLNIGRNNQQIAEIMRRSQEMGCHKVGFYAGPSDAEVAMGNARHCARLSENYVRRRTGGMGTVVINGRPFEGPALHVLEKELLDSGCDVPRVDR